VHALKTPRAAAAEIKTSFRVGLADVAPTRMSRGFSAVAPAVATPSSPPPFLPAAQPPIEKPLPSPKSPLRERRLLTSPGGGVSSGSDFGGGGLTRPSKRSEGPESSAGSAPMDSRRYRRHWRAVGDFSRLEGSIFGSKILTPPPHRRLVAPQMSRPSSAVSAGEAKRRRGLSFRPASPLIGAFASLRTEATSSSDEDDPPLPNFPQRSRTRSRRPTSAIASPQSSPPPPCLTPPLPGVPRAKSLSRPQTPLPRHLPPSHFSRPSRSSAASSESGGYTPPHQPPPRPPSAAAARRDTPRDVGADEATVHAALAAAAGGETGGDGTPQTSARVAGGGVEDASSDDELELYVKRRNAGSIEP
jgi:hypothetical protein